MSVDPLSKIHSNVKIPARIKISTVNLVSKLKSNINSANGMTKLGIPLSVLGIGAVTSGIGRHKIGQASDNIEDFYHSNHQDNNKNSEELNFLKNDISKKIDTIKNIQNFTLGCDIATLFVLPALITIPAAVLSNSVNWYKTGKLKNKLKKSLNNQDLFASS